jgi:hypothetical protein
MAGLPTELPVVSFDWKIGFLYLNKGRRFDRALDEHGHLPGYYLALLFVLVVVSSLLSPTMAVAVCDYDHAR